MPSRFRKRLASGYRSKFEERIAGELTKAKVKFSYEAVRLSYFVKVHNAYCLKCLTAAVSLRKYTPDFRMANGLILETKGKFTAKDRAKMEAVVEEHPDKNIRMLFMADNKINKNSKTRYSDWCKKVGIKYAVGKLPKSWIKEFKR